MLMALTVAAAYLIGSVPMGYVVVKLITGRDVRSVGSGRTGGTNAMRAAGLPAGLLTALLDVFKGAAGVWLAKLILSGSAEPLGMVLAGLAAILGHNYSVFLRFKGGAGGAPAAGAAMAIWAPIILIIVPVALVMVFIVGYASVATLVAAVMIIAVFAYRSYVLSQPIEFIYYGLGALALLAWALRPNIRRLLRGEERRVGLRSRRAEAGGSGDHPAPK